MPVEPHERVSSGVEGLDEIVDGGFMRGRSYLLTGPPGTGKTTLGWHFLTAGAPEPVLFITFGQPESELRQDAARQGFSVENVHFLDLSPSADVFEKVEHYDVFSPAEVEREPLVRSVMETIEKTRPCRIFIDSMTYLRSVSAGDSQFRKQTLAFLRYLTQGGAAVLTTSESSDLSPDDDLRFLSGGVIELAYGERNRTLEVTKFRGSTFRSGVHTLTLGPRGARVFPRLDPDQHHARYEDILLQCGIAKLDQMLHGGIERGTVTLLTGPSGVGKTSMGIQFMKEAASRGERTAIFTFDETRQTMLRRAEGTNTRVQDMIERGTLSVTEIEALRYGPDEFANMVRADVDQNGTRLVMIDSVSGYRLSVSGNDLQARLHALCKFLQNVGVTVLLINELQDINDFRISETSISYLCDNIIYLRYMQMARGNGHAELGRAVGVLKKRLSDFDKGLYSFEITGEGIRVTEPLTSFGGILPPIPVPN
jgi:circadian clock protein KaiC